MAAALSGCCFVYSSMEKVVCYQKLDLGMSKAGRFLSLSKSIKRRRNE